MSNAITILPKVVGTATVRKAVNKMLRLESLAEPERVSETLLSHSSQLSQPGVGSESPPMANVTITGAPTSMSLPPCTLPGYPQNYPPPTLPYPVFPSQFALPGVFNPYGVGFPPPYIPGYPLSAAPLSTWLPQGGLYSSPIGFAANGSVNPTDQQPKHSLQLQEEEVRKLERELDMQRIANDQKAEAKEFSRLQDRLKELQESIQRRREEKKRALDHEDWIAKQKRELVALRLQRTLQHDSSGLAALNGAASELQDESPQVYDSESGFMLLWDYAVGVPTATSGLQVHLLWLHDPEWSSLSVLMSVLPSLQITYAVFEGKLIRTPFKVVSAKEMESVGPQHKRCVFLSGRHVKKLLPSVDLRVVIEVP
ncbi:hypothetical protein BBJ28_00009740 [Nothophytophthora sp. Chile5]|nr:hypothetical protein BBJ28_00009740 [Nothophytophthora sp. Chile5]